MSSFLTFGVVSELRTEYTTTKHVLLHTNLKCRRIPMGVEHSMFESGNLGMFGIGDEHCKNEKRFFINKRIYVKVVQVVAF